MTTDATPEWTEYRKKSGLDPLGMQNTSVGLYQTLLPGISNVTLRVRYYGLYAWLSAAYAREVRETDPKTWQRFLRRAEALYALAAQRRGSETGVAGTLWAATKLARSDGEIAFADDAEPGSPTHYLKQAWGAYGAAYGSQLFEIGVLAQTSGHLIPVPSAEVGEVLAETFADSLGVTAQRYLEVVQRGVVTVAELDAFSSMCPSEIPPGSEERRLYELLLLAQGAQRSPKDLSRRKTLLLILSLSQHLGRAPEPQEIRWALYESRFLGGGDLSLPEILDAHRASWASYQTNDLSHICFETLLRFVLCLLEGYPDGIPLRTLIGTAIAEIRVAAGTSCPATWAALLDTVTLAPNASATHDRGQELAMVEEVMRAARQGGACDGATAWQALVLLAVLHNRVRSQQAQIVADLGSFNPAVFRSVLTETTFLEEHASEPFDRLLGRILEERVIRRHLWIALRKLRYQGDYTFLLEADNGRVRLRGMDGPVYTNPRLGPSITFLRDIGLLDGQGTTKEGQRCLAEAA